MFVVIVLVATVTCVGFDPLTVMAIAISQGGSGNGCAELGHAALRTRALISRGCAGDSKMRPARKTGHSKPQRLDPMNWCRSCRYEAAAMPPHRWFCALDQGPR